MKQKVQKGKNRSFREAFRSADAIRLLIYVLGTAVIIGLFEVAIVPMRYNLQVGMVPTTTISAIKDVVTRHTAKLFYRSAILRAH